MVYGSYHGSGKEAFIAVTPLDLALKQVTTLESMATLKKVTQNVAQQPAEPKFRKLKLSNEKIKALIMDVPGALDALLVLGWERASEEGLEVLNLAAEKHMKMADVRLIQAAEERLVEHLKAKARAETAARSCANDPEREAIRLQLEADKRERAARGPVTVGSVAVKMGEFGTKRKESDPPGTVRGIHSASAWEAVLAEGKASSRAVLVDFSATWCGPCKAIAPVFEAAAAANPSVIFCKVDVDECTEVSSACGVSAMPTFQLFKGGVKVDELRGADPARLAAMIKAAA